MGRYDPTMTISVDMYEAKTTLARLVSAAQTGEEVVITRRGQPVVRLEPVSVPRSEPRLSLYGSLKDQIKMADDFEELPEEILKPLRATIQTIRCTERPCVPRADPLAASSASRPTPAVGSRYATPPPTPLVGVLIQKSIPLAQPRAQAVAVAADRSSSDRPTEIEPRGRGSTNEAGAIRR